MTDQTLISVSVHSNYDHLPRGATKEVCSEDKRRMGRKAVRGWQRKAWTLEQFAAHLDAERGFAAIFTDGHRHNESAQAQFVCIDDDQGDPDFYRHIEALGCAAVAGETTTPGHHRAVLPLAQLVTDPVLYKLLFARVTYHFHGVIDPAGGVISQPWLGFRQSTTWIVRGEFLTVDEIMSWPAPPEPERAWRRELDQPMIRLTGTRAEQRASEQKQRIIDEYLTVPGGAGLRHQAFIRLVAKLIARRDWPGLREYRLRNPRHWRRNGTRALRD